MLPIAEIERFLKDFKFKLGFWGLLFQNRLDRKNLQTLKDTLYNGPDMWVFGKKIRKREVYIKITIGPPNDKVICISFHFAEHPMDYPYKKQQ